MSHQGVVKITVLWDSNTGECSVKYSGPAVHENLIYKLLDESKRQIVAQCCDSDGMIIDTDNLDEDTLVQKEDELPPGFQPN